MFENTDTTHGTTKNADVELPSAIRVDGIYLLKLDEITRPNPDVHNYREDVVHYVLLDRKNNVAISLVSPKQVSKEGDPTVLKVFDTEDRQRFDDYLTGVQVPQYTLDTELLETGYRSLSAKEISEDNESKVRSLALKISIRHANMERERKVMHELGGEVAGLIDINT